MRLSLLDSPPSTQRPDEGPAERMAEARMRSKDVQGDDPHHLGSKRRNNCFPRRELQVQVAPLANSPGA